MNSKRKLGFILCTLVVLLLTAVSAVAESTLMAADTDEAVLMLREQLVARNEDFTILVPGKSMKEKEFNKLYEQALEHTGNPKEGDYLRAHMIDCIPEITKTKVEKKNYVQIHLQPNYKSTAAMEQEVDAAVEAFFATYPVKEKATQYEKIEAVYDYLCDTITYDYARKHDTKLYFDEREAENVLIANTAYAGLVEGTCVCEGYASSFYRLMLEMGIDARLVEGFAGEEHAWNIVELDGKYYYLDATWDASNLGWFDYFLQAELWNHTPESEFLKEYTMATEAYPMPEKELFTSGHYTYSVTYGACIHQYTGSERNVVIPERLGGNPVVSTKYYEGMVPFLFGEMSTITYPEGFRHIRNTGIEMCSELTDIYLPSTYVWSQDEHIWLYGCEKLTGFHVAENNKHLQVIDGIVYTKDGKTLRFYPYGREEETVIVPEGVETIAMSAFSNAQKVRKVVLPEGVHTIDDFAFKGATALEEINIPETCTYIGQWSLGDTALKELHLPVGIVDFSAAATANTRELQVVTIPEGNEKYFVQDNCLYDVYAPGETRLFVYPEGREDTHFTVPNGVINIASYAFSCSKLESVTLNEELMGLSNDSFRGSAIKEIVLPESVFYVDSVVFGECPNLTAVTALNDEINLYEDSFGWFWEGGPAKPLLRGHKGSTIETFAQTYDFPFEVIE